LASCRCDARPLILLLATLLGAAGTAGADTQKDFEAATALEAKGDFAGAARALEALAAAHPDDSFADDALFEAALLAEERLANPAHALELYRKVLERWPNGRLSRRAKTRVDFLSQSLRTGAEPLVEFQAITSGVSARPPAESIARMEQLLAKHPDFALADRSLFWLGQALADAGRHADALPRWEELARRFPSSEWTVRAIKAKGDLLLRTGHPLDARRVFESLASRPDMLARAFAEEGLRQAKSVLVLRTLFFVSLGYLALFLLAHVVLFVRLRERPKLHAELLYYLPVAALFSIAGATENVSIGITTTSIAAGGAVILFATVSLAGAQAKQKPLTRLSVALRGGAAALAALALAFAAIHATRLTELVLETLKMGPER
jgi:TolA-binding protein